MAGSAKEKKRLYKQGHVVHIFVCACCKKKTVEAAMACCMHDEPTGESDKKAIEEGTFPFELLTNDLALAILDKVGLEEKLGTVPLVCKRWHGLTQEPACWKTLRSSSTTFRWSATKSKLLQLFIPRNNPVRLRRFECDDISLAGLELVAQRQGQSLEELYINDFWMSDEVLCEVAPKLPFIRSLDVMGCSYLTEASLEAFGRHCKSLIHLAVHPPNNEQCLAIVKHMPQLEYLKVVEPLGVYLAKGMLAILENSTNLKALDFECWQSEDFKELLVFRIEIPNGGKARAAAVDKFKEEYARKAPQPRG